MFEPRYREMITDALAGNRIIGMTPAPARMERGLEGRPPVCSIGSAGLITFSEQHSDGRYNIVLRGLEKFRVAAKDHSRSYRVAGVESLDEGTTAEDREIVRAERRRLEALLVPQPEGRGVDSKMPPSMSDEDIVNALAQYLDLEPIEKQALFEREGLVAHCRSLIDLLEMKVIVAQRTWRRRIALTRRARRARSIY